MAPSTVRGYHLTLRMFCDYLTDARYDWPRQCLDRFGQVPSQVCHEWNTVAHLNEYEGRPARRPLTYDELQVLFDFVKNVDHVVSRPLLAPEESGRVLGAPDHSDATATRQTHRPQTIALPAGRMMAPCALC